jgi:hypothetical protein
MYLYLYLYIYIYTYKYTYIHIYVYVYIYIFTHVFYSQLFCYPRKHSFLFDEGTTGFRARAGLRPPGAPRSRVDQSSWRYTIKTWECMGISLANMAVYGVLCFFF